MIALRTGCFAEVGTSGSGPACARHLNELPLCCTALWGQCECQGQDQVRGPADLPPWISGDPGAQAPCTEQRLQSVAHTARDNSG